MWYKRVQIFITLEITCFGVLDRETEQGDRQRNRFEGWRRINIETAVLHLELSICVLAPDALRFTCFLFTYAHRVTVPSRVVFVCVRLHHLHQHKQRNEYVPPLP